MGYPSAVRRLTDNAYFANDRGVYVVNGRTRCTTKFKTAKPSEGGLVATAIAIDQGRGRIYVSNRQGAHNVTVLRDGKVSCRRRH